MATTSPAAREGQTFDGVSRWIRYANFVKLPHTVFALPFALVGAILASYRHAITVGPLLWIVVAFTAARFAAPVTIAINRLGTLFVGELSGGDRGFAGPIVRTVRQVTSSGVVTTVVGSPGGSGNIVDALPASLGFITSIAVISDKQIAITSDDGVFVATFP